MATHSRVLAWRIPGTGEPGGLPSMGSHRVGHDLSDLAAAAAATALWYARSRFIRTIIFNLTTFKRNHYLLWLKYKQFESISNFIKVTDKGRGVFVC